ncbi:MAG: exodeoxyribonuclease I [Pseudomonadota bacterium]
MTDASFYWHDYETWGANPQLDRPAQFAGQRTDLELNPIGNPLVLYAKPTPDYLPHPDACLLTGITPQQAHDAGVAESDFIARIHRELYEPGTCSLGYNSLRFDDTVTRFTLHRNLRDPYRREYGQGRSRWDLIDAVRTAYALRPDGINWPRRSDGLPSFRLEDLAAANELDQESAHDALSDVKATIALARLLKDKQPRLFEWLFTHRSKAAALKSLELGSFKPLLHVSGMFGAVNANLGVVVPICKHESNSNEVIMVDLRVPLADWLELPVSEIKTQLYTSFEMLGPGLVRPGIKSVHLNRCPVLLPFKMLSDEVALRAGIDRAMIEDNANYLKRYEARYPGSMSDKLRQAVCYDSARPSDDVDLSLYSGGFLSALDRSTLDDLLRLDPTNMTSARPIFEDNRLEAMWFRFRARNYPDTLLKEEREAWLTFCAERLTNGVEGAENGSLSAPEFEALIEVRRQELSTDKQKVGILNALEDWFRCLSSGEIGA